MSTNPWTWRPSLEPWFARLRARLLDWTPTNADMLLSRELKMTLTMAAYIDSDWLYHPFCAKLVGDGPLSSTFCEAQLIAWSAVQAPALGGSLALTQTQRLFRGDGRAADIDGHISVSDLRAMMLQGPATSLGVDDPLVLECDPTLTDDSLHARQGVTTLLATLPDVAGWLRATTRALDLLPAGYFADAPEDALVSCSSPEVPGFIRITPSRDLLKLLEMLVHETAHLYLFRAETAAPLIDPSSKLSFSSPLRHEPRPLRGILLAFHACAYIAAAYAAAKRSNIAEASQAEHERLRVLALFEESRTIITAAKCNFTEAGVDFVRRTEAVADFACSDQ